MCGNQSRGRFPLCTSPTDMAFDFLGLMRAPEARSNSGMASSIIGKSAIEVTKMVTSSAYVITDV